MNGQKPTPKGPTTLMGGVGPAKARLLASVGLNTLEDLCLLTPTSLTRWPAPLTSGPLPEEGLTRVSGSVLSVKLVRMRGKQSRVTLVLDAGGWQAQASFWNQPWVRERCVVGDQIELCGEARATTKGPELLGPKIGTERDPLPAPGALVGNYPSPKGMSGHVLAGLCKEAVQLVGQQIREPLPEHLLAAGDLPDLPTAVHEAHDPRSGVAFEAARRRLALIPLLALQAQLAARRSGSDAGGGRPVSIGPDLNRELQARLPFQLTPDQSQAWKVLARDLGRRSPMRRILQGDVGTGKTALAALCSFAVVEGGGQVAFLVPTEVLAEQHHMGLAPLLDAVGIGYALLTGRVRGEERRNILRRLANGEVSVLFGTHAIFQKGVEFSQLDLVIIDEQQRFGVGQRSALMEKGKGAHLLLMTATPIPRTLALTVYGDLEVVTLRNGPPGRGEVHTRWVRGQKTRSIIPWLAKRMEAGEQVYWVCPRIGKDGDDTPGAAQARFDKLCEDERVNSFGVELVHGKVPAEERSWRLERFRRGDIGLLVATTVIEVGVDVASATVMVIEQADRLGLAQLHQLRGRVGRGPLESWCLLVGAAAAEERFTMLLQTRDGFEIAEEDLRRRGMGDLAGLRQAGNNHEGLNTLEQDLDLLLLAREACQSDPRLVRELAHGPRPLLAP